MHNIINRKKIRKSNQIELVDIESSSQPSSTSQHIDGANVVVSLNQQEVRRSSALMVTDRDFNVISITQSFYDIFGLDPLPLPISIDRVVCAQETAGWFVLSDAFGGDDMFKAAMHKVRSNQYFHDFHISPLGEVIDVAHYQDLESGNIFFNYTPTAIIVEPTSETSYEVRGLLALRDLTMLGMCGIFPLTFELTQPDGQTCAPLICAPKSGRVVIFDEDRSFPELIGIQFLEDLSLKMQDIISSLGGGGQYYGRVELEGSKPLQLVLKRQFFYSGGPSFLVGKVTRLCRVITAESILNEFPIFSSKEAEVVCLLAHGHTMKESAAKTGKAQVTVSLQARSALLKSGERSINALVARITHSRPQCV